MFEKYYKVLSAHAYHLLENMEEAEDIVQDVFIKLLILKNIGNRIHDLRSYLFRCVHNRCLNHLSSKRTNSTRNKVYIKEALGFLHFEQFQCDQNNSDKDSTIGEVYKQFAEFPPQCGLALS